MQSQFEDAANAVAYKFRPPNDQVDAPKPTARHSFIHESACDGRRRALVIGSAEFGGRGITATSRRQTLGRQNAELEKLKEQRRQLVEAEKRLRDNLAAVGHDTALYKQTLDKLGETEATISTLSSAIAATTKPHGSKLD